MGEIDEYDLEKESIDVYYDVVCGAIPGKAASTETVKDTIKLKTTNYGRSHFTNRIAKFATVKDCIDHKKTLESCFKEIKPTAASTANDMASLFEKCFTDNNISNVEIAN